MGEDNRFDTLLRRLSSFRVRRCAEPHQLSFRQLCVILPVSILTRLPALTISSYELPKNRAACYKWLTLGHSEGLLENFLPSHAFNNLRAIHFDHVYFETEFIELIPVVFPFLQVIHITNPKCSNVGEDVRKISRVARAFGATHAKYCRLTFNSLEIACQPWVEAFATHCGHQFLDFTLDTLLCVVRELVESALLPNVDKWIVHHVSPDQSQSCWIAGPLDSDSDEVFFRALEVCKSSHFVRHFQKELRHE